MCSSSWEGTTMLLILMDDVSTVNSQVASTSTRSTRRGFGPRKLYTWLEEAVAEPFKSLPKLQWSNLRLVMEYIHFCFQ
ncbi:hypothetical protein BDL97_15G026300 [Sphagnum fallax]|nr:hypothetical protein BDL97_15G026300 [Sphagnum fallax]